MSAGDLPRGGRDLRRCRRSRRRRRDLHRDEPKLFRRRGRPRGQLPLPPGQPARLNSTRCGEVGGALPTLVPGRDQSGPLLRAPAPRLLCSISHATTRTANDAPMSRRGPRNSYTPPRASRRSLRCIATRRPSCRATPTRSRPRSAVETRGSAQSPKRSSRRQSAGQRTAGASVGSLISSAPSPASGCSRPKIRLSSSASRKARWNTVRGR